MNYSIPKNVKLSILRMQNNSGILTPSQCPTPSVKKEQIISLNFTFTYKYKVFSFRTCKIIADSNSVLENKSPMPLPNCQYDTNIKNKIKCEANKEINTQKDRNTKMRLTKIKLTIIRTQL